MKVFKGRLKPSHPGFRISVPCSTATLLDLMKSYVMFLWDFGWFLELCHDSWEIHISQVGFTVMMPC